MLLLIFLIAVFLIGMLVVRAVPYYAEKMYFEVPPMEWIDLEKLAKMGYPRLFCKIILPILKKKGRSMFGKNKVWTAWTPKP